MYEQSSASVKPNEDELMNMPISAQKDRCCVGLDPTAPCLGSLESF